MLELRGLRVRDASALVRELHPGLGREPVRAVVARAAGNPLLLEELSAGDSPHETLLLSLVARLPERSDPAWSALLRLALLRRPAGQALLGDGVEELLAGGLATRQGDDVALLGTSFSARPCSIHWTRSSGRSSTDSSPATSRTRARRPATTRPRGAALARDHALRAADQARRPGDRAQQLALAARCTPEGDDDAASAYWRRPS